MLPTQRTFRFHVTGTRIQDFTSSRYAHSYIDMYGLHVVHPILQQTSRSRVCISPHAIERAVHETRAASVSVSARTLIQLPYMRSIHTCPLFFFYITLACSIRFSFALLSWKTDKIISAVPSLLSIKRLSKHIV